MAARSFIVGLSRSPQDRFLVASECSLARLRRIENGKEEDVDVSAENEENIEVRERERGRIGQSALENILKSHESKCFRHTRLTVSEGRHEVV
jgi:hypothetical protein